MSKSFSFKLKFLNQTQQFYFYTKFNLEKLKNAPNPPTTKNEEVGHTEFLIKVHKKNSQTIGCF